MNNQNLWTKSNNDSNWNAKEAEKDISKLYDLRTIITSLTPIMCAANGIDGIEREAAAAAEEMDEILKNKDNSSGYHLNYIRSEKMTYALYNNGDAKIYKFDSKFNTKEEAEKRVSELKDAYTEYYDDLEGKNWFVLTLDEEQTECARLLELGGELVGEFDTLEEAKAAAKNYKYSYINEYPKDEWWIVVDNRTNRGVYQILFPTEERALTFLYKVAQPKAWCEYIAARNKKNAEKSKEEETH